MITNLKERVRTGVVPPNFAERVTFRVVEAEFTAESKSSGEPNICLKCEIIRPQDVVVDGIKYDLTSCPVNFYFAYVNEKAMDSLALFHQVMGLPPEFDTEKPDVSIYKGLVFEFAISTQEDFKQRRDPKNPRKYISMFESDGKTPISLGWKWNTFLDATLRRSTEEVNRPY